MFSTTFEDGGTGFNSNTWVFHPGSRLRFDNNTPFTGSGTTGTQAGGTIGGEGRWADSVGITLDGAVLDMVGDNTDHAANKEIVGDITTLRGAEVVVRRSTGFGAELITSNLIRGSSNATLMLRHDADLLGDAGSVNTDRFIVSSGAGVGAGEGGGCAATGAATGRAAAGGRSCADDGELLASLGAPVVNGLVRIDRAFWELNMSVPFALAEPWGTAPPGSAARLRFRSRRT